MFLSLTTHVVGVLSDRLRSSSHLQFVWVLLLAKALEGKDVKELLSNIHASDAPATSAVKEEKEESDRHIRKGQYTHYQR